MAGRKIPLGVVWTGRIARTVYLAGFRRISERVELVSAFDVEVERVGQAAKDFGVAHAFTSFEQFLDRPAFDAVAICTPSSAHAPPAIRAFERVPRVLCE